MSLRRLLNEETEITKTIFKVYTKSFIGDASKEEIKRANKDLLELFKKLGVGSILLIVPFSLFLFPVVVKIGRWYGVELLPESFRKQIEVEVIQPIDAQEEQSPLKSLSTEEE